PAGRKPRRRRIAEAVDRGPLIDHQQVGAGLDAFASIHHAGHEIGDRPHDTRLGRIFHIDDDGRLVSHDRAHIHAVVGNSDIAVVAAGNPHRRVVPLVVIEQRQMRHQLEVAAKPLRWDPRDGRPDSGKVRRGFGGGAANPAPAPATAIPSPHRASQPYRNLRKNASSAIAATPVAARASHVPGAGVCTASILAAANAATPTEVTPHHQARPPLPPGGPTGTAIPSTPAPTTTPHPAAVPSRLATSASRTRSLVLVMTDPGNGSRICSVAVEWGRGWFTAGAAACLPRMPQPAASTRMLIIAARAARDIVNGLLGRSKPSVIPTNLVR